MYTNEALTDRFGEVDPSELFGINCRIIGTDEDHVYVVDGPSDVQWLEEEQKSQDQYEQLAKESQAVLEGFLNDNPITMNAQFPGNEYYSVKP